MSRWEVRIENESGEVMHINATSEFGDEDSLVFAKEIITGAKSLFRKNNLEFYIEGFIEDETEEEK